MRLVLLANLFQLTLWLAFFPETPSVPDGEPKEHSMSSISIWACLLLLFAGGISLGKNSLAGSSRRYVHPGKCGLSGVLFVGWIAFGISFITLGIQLLPVIQEWSTLLLLSLPFGQNMLARMLHEASPFGVPTISTLNVLAMAVFASAALSPSIERKRRIWYGLVMLILLCLAFAYSIVLMTRQAFIYLLLQLFAAAVLVGRWRIRWPQIGLCVALLIGWVWIQGAIRMAGLENLSVEGGMTALDELAEKYLPGELNSTLILMTYPSDVTKNWLHGTMFSRFSPEGYMPSRSINTTSMFGHWYWQAGVLSPVLAVVMGFMIGLIFAFAKSTGFGLNFPTVFYLVTYPALVMSLRTNAFFLAPFLLPMLFCAGSGIILYLVTGPSFIRSRISHSSTVAR